MPLPGRDRAGVVGGGCGVGAVELLLADLVLPADLVVLELVVRRAAKRPSASRGWRGLFDFFMGWSPELGTKSA